MRNSDVDARRKTSHGPSLRRHEGTNSLEAPQSTHFLGERLYNLVIAFVVVVRQVRAIVAPRGLILRHVDRATLAVVFSTSADA